MADRSLIGITAGLGLPGLAKLAGAPPVVANFERWGFPQQARYVVGGIEVGIAAVAIAAMKDPIAKPIAGAATLCTMAGAIATHKRANDPVLQILPAFLVAFAGAAALAGR